MSPWRLSHRFDPAAAAIADRHYNRQTHGSPQFAPPGYLLVLLAGKRKHAPKRQALWCSSWQKPEFVKHAWPGAWVNSLFRNEGAGLSSDLIRAAVACTRWKWPTPAEGMVTFIDPAEVRAKADPGRCYLAAGFRSVGETASGLIALRLDPSDMPDASEPSGPLQLALAVA